MHLSSPKVGLFCARSAEVRRIRGKISFVTRARAALRRALWDPGALSDISRMTVGKTCLDDSFPEMATHMASAPDRFSLAGLSMGVCLHGDHNELPRGREARAV